MYATSRAQHFVTLFTTEEEYVALRRVFGFNRGGGGNKANGGRSVAS